MMVPPASSSSLADLTPADKPATMDTMNNAMLIIRTNGKIELVENDSLESIQAAVGGYFDTIGMNHNSIMYVHDEGRLVGDHPNWLATELVKAMRPNYSLPVVGDAVVVGTLDKDGVYTGEDYPVPDDIVKFVTKKANLLTADAGFSYR
jgi:hypothetical protein